MYTKQQILQGLQAGPRVVQPFALPCAQVLRHPWMEAQLAGLVKTGEEYLAQPTPPLPYSKFRLYWQTGDRSQFEQAYFVRRGRLLVFSLLCWLRPDEDKWLQALQDIIWDICAEPFWCLPAHFFGVEDGAQIPFEEYATHLDLFSSETAFALAECYSLVGHRLEPMVAEQLQLQIERRVFAPFLQGGRAFRFEHLDNNWSAVCAGAIGGAALYLMEDDGPLVGLLHRCLACMEVFLQSFGADGICVEGVGYWTYGFGFFTCFAELLCRRTAGVLDLLAAPGVDAIARGQQVFYLQDGITISFADGFETAAYRLGLGCFLQKRFSGVHLPRPEYADGMLGDNCHRFCMALRDVVWFDPDAVYGIPDEHEGWYADAQWFVSAKGPLAVAAKGGHNAKSHNHNDCGSFILVKDGQVLLCDLGAGLYTRQYFGPGRYEIFVNQACSHNVAMINGGQQQAGRQHAAQDAIAQFGKEENRFCCRLETCYTVEGLESYSRTLVHSKQGNSLRLEDSFRFAVAGSMRQVFVAHHPFVLTPQGARLQAGEVQTQLLFDTGRFAASCAQQQYPDHDGQMKTAHLLHIEPRQAANELVFTMEVR